MSAGNSSAGNSRTMPGLILGASFLLLTHSFVTQGPLTLRVDANFLPHISLLAIAIASGVLALGKRKKNVHSSTSSLRIGTKLIVGTAPLAMAGYLLAVLRLGLAVSTFLAVALGLLYFGDRSPLRVLLVGAAVAVFAYVAVVQVMGAFLPPSVLF